jgi:flagellar capping protein FliD
VEITRTVNLTKGKTLQGVVDAIKEQHGDIVQAAIVNTDGGTPKYALSLQSTKLGKVGFELLDGTHDLFGAVTNSFADANGSTGKYNVNGLEVETPTRSITIAPNLTAQLVKADQNKDITVSVKQGTIAMSGSVERTTSPRPIWAAGLASANPPPRPRTVATNPARPRLCATLVRWFLGMP